MFTNTFALDHHIEELRAELRGTTDTGEARCIEAVRDDLIREVDPAL
jgi:hypothetical protein